MIKEKYFALSQTIATFISMKIAIISDIHANLEALTTALEFISQSDVQSMYCLGDVVGYGANPNECVELLQKNTIPCVVGNHDKAVFDVVLQHTFSAKAKSALEWTKNNISFQSLNFLKDLPPRIIENGCTFVHSTPDQPFQFKYILDQEDAEHYFPFFETQICFIGHSHRAGIFCDDGITQRVQREKKFIVNVGSIGQPRDGDWKLSFGVFDTERCEYQNIRLEYDVETARQKIIDAGLPTVLGDRLLVGV